MRVNRLGVWLDKIQGIAKYKSEVFGDYFIAQKLVGSNEERRLKPNLFFFCILFGMSSRFFATTSQIAHRLFAIEE